MLMNHISLTFTMAADLIFATSVLLKLTRAVTLTSVSYTHLDVYKRQSYDMTLEATVTKMMWALAQTKEQEVFEKLFYQTINHDILFR